MDKKRFDWESRESRQNQADVSMSLAKHVMLNDGKDSNLVFSPISIQVMLSLIAAGSGAQTLDQLLSFLKAESIDELNYLYSHLVDRVFADASSSGGPFLSFANGVWLDESLSFKPSFKHVVGTLYKAASHRVDFKNKDKAEEVRNLVNSWVEKKTSGLVKEILPPKSVHELIRLVFANALYFKGAWSSNYFDSSKTKDYDFHLLNGDSIQVPFMTSRKMQFISAFDGFKVLKLPYKTGLDRRFFSMLIFLPDAKDGLPALVEKAGSESGFLDRHIPYDKVWTTEFRIPKFKFEYKFEASDTLKSLGLVLPFDPEVGLTEIVDDPWPLFVSAIYHKSCIEVNEEGTEAAAASAALMGFGCAMITAIDFVADHPFLFAIREDISGIVQFIGHVLNPSTT